MLNDNLKFKNNLKIFLIILLMILLIIQKKLANELCGCREHLFNSGIFLGKKEFYEELKKSKNQEQFIFNLKNLF